MYHNHVGLATGSLNTPVKTEGMVPSKAVRKCHGWPMDLESLLL